MEEDDNSKAQRVNNKKKNAKVADEEGKKGSSSDDAEKKKKQPHHPKKTKKKDTSSEDEVKDETPKKKKQPHHPKKKTNDSKKEKKAEPSPSLKKKKGGKKSVEENGDDEKNNHKKESDDEEDSGEESESNEEISTEGKKASLEEQMVIYKNKYVLEKWYDNIKDHTFFTETVVLPADVAKALVHAYHQYHIIQRQQQRDMEEIEKGRKKREEKVRPRTKSRQKRETRVAEKLSAKADRTLWDEDHSKVLGDFEEMLDGVVKEFLEKHPEGGDRVFFKLSTRSPKDSAMESRYMRKIFKEELLGLVQAGHVKKGKLDENLELSAFVNCIPRCMTVDCGKAAVDLMIKSERSFTDINRWLEFSDSLDPMHLVFRTFEKDLKASLEFRGFVHKKKLNALSQYYDMCCFPEVVEKKEEIQEKLTTYFDEIKDLIPLNDYVIDFAVLEEKIMIIEINPWATTTGGALFSWQEDRQVLLDGPFEFRIITGPISGIGDTIFPELKELLDSVKLELSIKTNTKKGPLPNIGPIGEKCVVS